MTQTATVDYSSYTRVDDTGTRHLLLAVEGMHCAGCAAKIERALNTGDNLKARVNLTRRHLTLAWHGNPARGNAAIDAAEKLGFRLSPVVEERGAADLAAESWLLRCIAVAGFAAGNIMIFSLALWFSDRPSMGGSTQDVFHWCSALIALPAVVYAGRPFFFSAWRALKRGGTNMDVPISVGIILSTGMSVAETLRHGEYVYFDSAVMLLFLLLCGRFLDQRARGRARAAAADILSLTAGSALVIDGGVQRRLPAEDLQKGMTVIIAAGERVLADGTVLEGSGAVDTAAITGESLPTALHKGDAVLAGMVNLGAPLTVRVEKSAASSLMADIARLMEKAEQGNAAYVRIADRLARWYTPLVHALALLTFLGWHFGMGQPWQPALMNAVTVLIITCPCALGLAVPVAQVLASQRLFRTGSLVKSGDAFERLARIDTVVFDKTGTLTTGALEWLNADALPPESRHLAQSFAAYSRHPLCRAIAGDDAVPHIALMNVEEVTGQGISADDGGNLIRLGTAAFCGAPAVAHDDMRDVWLRIGQAEPFRLVFTDKLRADAAETVRALATAGLHVMLLSGDRAEIAAAAARQLGIEDVKAAIDPREKAVIIDRLKNDGHAVLMVGDGMNDAPSLAAANISMSPSSAVHLTQNAADIVFQGNMLAPVAAAWRTAVFCQRIVRQNFTMALGYNLVAVPLAVAGHVTPLIAAVAMSVSSLAVVGNALRISRRKDDAWISC